jgi:hypothetical protein
MADIEANRPVAETGTEQIEKYANRFVTFECILFLVYYLTQLIYGTSHKDSCDAFITLSGWLVIQGIIGITYVAFCLFLIRCDIFKQIQEGEGNLFVAFAKIIINIFTSVCLGWTITGTILLSQCYHQTPSGIPTFVLTSLILQYGGTMIGNHNSSKDDDKTWLQHYSNPLKTMCAVIQLFCSLTLSIVELVYGMNYHDTCGSFMTFSHWLKVDGAIGIVICVLFLKFFIEFDFTERNEKIMIDNLMKYGCILFPATILSIFMIAWFITGFVLYCNCFYASPAPIHALMTAVVVIGFTNIQTAK